MRVRTSSARHRHLRVAGATRVIDLDIHQLEYFVCAANTGSYSQAARLLFVSPQAISRSIQLLEARTGMKLFERTSGGIALTDFGKVCLGPAQEALDALQQFQDMATRYRQGACSTISLGIHSLCFQENGGSIARNDLLAFQKQHSTVTLSFIEMTGDAIIDALQKDAIDFGITVAPRSGADGLEQRFLKSFCIAALVSESFARRYAQEDGSVAIEDLANGELVLFSDETEYNDFLIEHARAAGCSLPVSSLKISPQGDMGFIADRRLYVIRPLQHALRTVHDERLRVLPIRNQHGEEIRIPLALLSKRGHTNTSAEDSLLEFIEGCYR